jgi:hypothetical protein
MVGLSRSRRTRRCGIQHCTTQSPARKGRRLPECAFCGGRIALFAGYFEKFRQEQSTVKTNRRFRPALEMLEDRWTPAGTVTGSFANGTWTLIGDDQANAIAISPLTTPGVFGVAGIFTTNTAVTGVTNPTGVKNIVVKLFSGADFVLFNATAMQATLAGNLTINGGDDANEVFINNAVVGKKVSVINGTNATGIDNFELTDSVVKGAVSLANGEGNSSTFIHRNTAGPSFIGGLTILNGTGRDDCTITDTNFGGSIVVKNGLPDSANDAGYFEIYNLENTTGRSVIAGGVTIKYEAGDGASADLLDVEVRGSVTINQGSGTSETNFDGYTLEQPVLIRGNVSVLGTGPSLIAVGKYGTETGLVVGRNLTIITGDQADTIDAYRLRVHGATLIQTGGGTDTVTIDDSRFLGLLSFPSPFGFRLFTGAGNDTVNIETAQLTTGPTQILSPALVNLGSGNDTLTTGFSGDATRRLQVFRPTFLFGGADTDTFNRLNLARVLGAPASALFETINV